jgi:hypothetical protein
MDGGISELSDDIFSHLQQKKQLEEDSGEIEADSPCYKKPQRQIDSKTPVNQHIRFNLIQHRGVNADIPVLKLFKSFASAFKKAGPSLIILPFHSNKQHY